MGRHELTPYAIINACCPHDAPQSAVRTVYTALFRNLFWVIRRAAILVDDPQAYNAFLYP